MQRPIKFMSLYKHFISRLGLGMLSLPVVVVQGGAQEMLRLEDAIAISLEKNYALKLVQNDVAIATLNNSRANAGMLPTVFLNAGDNASAVNFQQKLANGTEISRPLGLFNSFSTSLNANWTIFDGKRTWLEKKRLESLDAEARALLASEVRATATGVALQWYEVARLEASIQNLDEIIATLTERHDLAAYRLEFGLGNKADVLQAKIDWNEREKQKIAAINDRNEAKRNLNNLLQRDPNIPFTLAPIATPLPQPPNLDTVRNLLMKQNLSLNVLEQQIHAAEIVADQAARLGKPRIGLTGAYNFQRSDNTTGFSLFTMQHGPAVGVNFSMPIYTGGNLKRQESVAKAQAVSANIRLVQLQENLLLQLYNIVARMEALQAALEIDTTTLDLARENVLISSERFRLGQSNSLEIREAQLSYENALFRANQTRFDLYQSGVVLENLLGG